MGFSLTLLIVHPWVASEKDTQTWDVQEAVTLGRVTRLEKLVGKHYRHLHFSSRSKAGICVTSVIFRRLVTMLQNPMRSHFVPRFVLEPYGLPSLIPDFDWNGVRSLPLWSSEAFLPSTDIMQGHNKIVAMDNDKLFFFIREKFNIVGDPLLMWQDCSIVAQWINTLLRASATQSGRVLREDPEARTYVRAWQRYLAEMGKLNTKIIFLFEDAETQL